jgi:hypothetical protein
MENPEELTPETTAALAAVVAHMANQNGQYARMKLKASEFTALQNLFLAAGVKGQTPALSKYTKYTLNINGLLLNLSKNTTNRNFSLSVSFRCTMGEAVDILTNYIGRNQKAQIEHDDVIDAKVLTRFSAAYKVLHDAGIELRIDRDEKMYEGFCKYYLENGQVLHHFTQPDTGYPHDHPFDFDTLILEGGYVEEVFIMLNNGTLYSEEITRRAGESHTVHNFTIHRINQLLGRECWTLITAGEKVREPGFYQEREDGIYHKYWNGEFTKIKDRTQQRGSRTE